MSFFNHTGSRKLKDLEGGVLSRVVQFLVAIDRKISLSLGLGCLLTMALVVLMIRTQPKNSSFALLKNGEIAPTTIRADKIIEFIEPEAEQIEKAQILSSQPPVYDLDTEAVSGWIDRWVLGVRLLKSKPKLEKKLQKKLFEEKVGISLTPAEFDVLASIGFGADLERSVNFAMGPLWDLRIIENRSFTSNAIEMVDIRSSKTIYLKSSELNYLLTLEDARALVGRAARTKSRTQNDKLRMPWASWDTVARETVFNIQSRLVTPTVTLNRKETEKRRELILKEFKPTSVRVEKGEVIVREGEKVSKKAQLILEEILKQQKASRGIGRIPLEIILGTVALWSLVIFARKTAPSQYFHFKDMLVAAAFLVTSVALLKLSLIFQIQIVGAYFEEIPKEFFIFLIPLAAPAMILRLLVRMPLATFFSIVYGTSVAIMLGDASLFGLHLVLTSLLATNFLRASRTRTDLHRAGLKTALITGVMAVLVLLAWGGMAPENAGLYRIDKLTSLGIQSRILWVFLGGLVGGWLSSAILMIVTPLIEGVLDYTTDLKLLELARMDHPLLRELVLKAPGTYHHSIVVGSLAEAGCEAVGANSLLARVGAYYHDIGKIGRAEYFVENQNPHVNPHEEMSPQLSAKIIIAHVKEGRVLAEQHKLGQALIDFIEQHHGTSTVNYFYNKAKHEASKPGSKIRPEEIREEDFKYPGPKPQTKEAAIMALADSCEAATRSLVEPTPARIEGMIQKIVSRAFSEGLLDEADITLREVQFVARAFLRILLGIHHNRIQYPDQEKGLPAPNQASNLIVLPKAGTRGTKS
jgi:putative nucleotidyltransferase with HDIG domain